MSTTIGSVLASAPDAPAPEAWGKVARIVIFSAIVPLALLVAPILTTQLIAERGLTAANVGNYFLFELGGISLASLPALWWMRRFNSRQIAPVAAVTFIAGNLMSTIVPGIELLYLTRLVTAMAGGALMLLCLNAAGAAANRDRLFGWWIAGQLVLGALGLSLLPRLFASFGLNAFYILLAAMMAAALPLAFRFDAPTIDPAPREPRGASTGGLLLSAVAMIAVFAFYIGLGGSWAFMSVIAERAGLKPLPVADTIAIASLLGIAGALLATFLGGRATRTYALFAGYALLLGAVLMLLGRLNMTAFAGAAYAFKFSWTFTLPFILAAIASRDTSGGIMAWVNMVIGFGTSIGPVITGRILGGAGAPVMLIFCATMIAASFALLLLIETGVVSGRARTR
ncbi:MFS transporter [uncultured Sphingomonas sp.]|uniref:MFS transporter n=1 Tax=uncultured Sphingomonas sp. TaxID=158754 RepID=UPI00260EEA82|nr:MFS transporter [uncultured Sphingomonas sp.]